MRPPPRVAFYTRVLGVEAGYGELDFYKKEIESDALRVAISASNEGTAFLQSQALFEEFRA